MYKSPYAKLFPSLHQPSLKGSPVTCIRHITLSANGERGALPHLFHLHAKGDLSCGHHAIKVNGIGLLGFLYLFHSAFAKDAMADAIACLESNP